MEIKVKRIARKESYTIGHLYIDGQYFCDTCEDTDRGLRQDLPLSVNLARKRKGITCIPSGRYQVTLGVKSPRFSASPQYKACNGYLPRLLNVPAFEGVLIHIGNTARDTDGCILVGRNTIKGQVTHSTDTFWKLYDRLQQAAGTIWLTIE